MALNVWQGTTAAYSTTGNWSLAAVPVATNDVLFSSSPLTGMVNSQSVTTGLNQSAVALATFKTDMGFTGDIGDATTYLQINSPVVTIGQANPVAAAVGSARINLDLAANSSTVTILGTRISPASGNVTAVRLKGSALTVLHQGGSASAAMAAGETSTIASLTLSGGFTSTAPKFFAGPGCTLTAAVLNAGALTSFSTTTAPSVIINAGTYTSNGSGAHTTLTVVDGKAIYNGNGTITNLSVTGIVDFSQGSGAVTVTNCTRYPGGTILDPNKRVTWTNPIADTGGAAMGDSKSDFGTNRNVKIS